MLSIDTAYSNFVDYLLINNDSHEEAKKFIWSKNECENIINSAKFLKSYPGAIAGEAIDLSFRKVMKYEIPNNNEFGWIYDKIAKTILSANSFYWNYDIDFIETVELLEYSFNPNEKFQSHYNKHSDFGPKMNKRKISYSALLSDPSDFQGGDFIFYLEKDIVLSKEQGQVILFPSFQFHSVSNVTQGTRWSLVTWISGRPFK